MTGMKPCPFCGSEVEIKKLPLRGYDGCYEFKIQCEKCGCRVNHSITNSVVYRTEETAKKKAIEAWNRRVTIEPERKTGRWIRWYEAKVDETGTEYIPHCRCSECGTEYDPHSSKFVSFCNVCGAKMEEGKQNDSF